MQCALGLHRAESTYQGASAAAVREEDTIAPCFYGATAATATPRSCGTHLRLKDRRGAVVLQVDVGRNRNQVETAPEG